MRLSTVLSRGAEAVVAIVVVSLLLGTLLGQPILLSYVKTGSMQPTMNPGDGFVAIPPQLAGPVHVGDVITYKAKHLHGGGLTTHRVFSKTSRGIVTKGDHNPFPDQAGPEPPVQRSQIKAVALQLGGHLVVIPNLGTGVEALKGAVHRVQFRLAATFHTRFFLGQTGILLLFAGGTVVLYALDALLGSSPSMRRERERRTSRSIGIDPRRVVVAVALLVVLVATASMVLPSATHSMGIRPKPSIGPDQTWHGSATFTVVNSAYLPTYVFVDTGSGVSAAKQVVMIPPRSVSKLSTAFSGTGPQSVRRSIAIRQYLAVLPLGVVRALYRIDPMAPVAAIDGLLATLVLLVGLPIADRVKNRSRRREAAPSLVRRVRAFLNS